ncbi:aldehyde dehydrogenase [Tsukamurella sp. NPDC003166]|uniref:aldehyde dehydrogenase n=1 Tax=Tsukamurella sp. NPDC003166 TaxID=3154444 RepID=UPI0033A0E1E3
MWQDNTDRFYIGGAWRPAASAETVDVVSPTTDETIARVALGAPSDMDAAVAAARDAFDRGPWPRMSVAERAALIRGFRDRLAGHGEQIAVTVTTEMGCPITQTRAAQVGASTALLDINLELAEQYPWRYTRSGRTGNAVVLRRPVGVVAAIVPWNSPVAVAMLKLAPALVAGCTVVLKPAPESPLSAHFLARAAAEAGLPPGVLNIVAADRAAGEHLVTHPGVDKVSFTGSTTAGRRIASACGNDLRRVTLELGGKSAAIILDDADLDAAVTSLRGASFRYNGQACVGKTRIIATRRRYAEVVDALTAMVGDLRVGDPADPDTEIGPLVSARQRDRVETYIAQGRAEGARVTVGGGRPADRPAGQFVQPTVFADVRSDMVIAQEEIFGPVICVLTADDEDEAIDIANDSAYGLSGAVYSADLDHAFAVAQRIRTGGVDINGAGIGFHAPFGGVKRSGIGREAGLEGFDAFVETTSFGVTAEALEHLS